MVGKHYLQLKKGDLVCYMNKHASHCPQFMMWPFFEKSGKPSLQLHPHKWKPGDLGVVVETFINQNLFLKLITQDGGFGWVLAAWCTPIKRFKQ